MRVGTYKGIVFAIDFGDVLAGLVAMDRLPSARLHREFKPLVRDDQGDHAAKRTGPSGAWARRAPATVQKMRLEGVRRRPLGRLTGRGVSYTANRLAVVGESKIPWSGSHQEGGRVGRGVVLPARPFLWLSTELLEAAESFLVDGVTDAFGGRS